jgi:hypothetical protein
MAGISGPNIVTSGLVLWLDAADPVSYPGSGTTWYDSSGNRNTGTITNSPTYNSANSGYFTFNGTTQYVSIGASVVPDNTSFTASLWLNYTITSGTFYDIVNTRATTANNPGFLLTTDNVSASGKIRVQLNTAAGVNSWTSSGASIATGTWKNVVISVDKTNNILTFYINATQDYSTSISVGAMTGQSTMTIAYDPAYAGAGNYFGGSISNMLVYNQALTVAQVQQNFNSLRYRYGI